MTDVIYPRLSTIVEINNLPEELSFVENGLNQLLNSLFFRNLSFHNSTDGTESFFSLDIIAAKLSVELRSYFGGRVVLHACW